MQAEILRNYIYEKKKHNIHEPWNYVCSNCGTVVSTTDRFCKYCGSSFFNAGIDELIRWKGDDSWKN